MSGTDEVSVPSVISAIIQQEEISLYALSTAKLGQKDLGQTLAPLRL